MSKEFLALVIFFTGLAFAPELAASTATPEPDTAPSSKAIPLGDAAPADATDLPNAFPGWILPAELEVPSSYTL